MRLGSVADQTDLSGGDRNATVRARLTMRLVTPTSMARGLERLAADLPRVTVIIRRSKYDRETAKFQAPYLTLFEGEQLVVDGSIDPRLLKARHVTLIGTTQDGGTARIDLTSRVVQTWASTAGLKEAIDSFNNELIKGARSRWFTGVAAAAMLVSIVPALLALSAIDGIVNPKVGRIIYSGKFNSPGTTAPFDVWAVRSGVVVFFLWLLLCIAAAIIMITIAQARPLRIWPVGLSLRSIIQTAYRIRFSTTLRQDRRSIIVGVITGLLVLFAYSFLRRL